MSKNDLNFVILVGDSNPEFSIQTLVRFVEKVIWKKRKKKKEKKRQVIWKKAKSKERLQTF